MKTKHYTSIIKQLSLASVLIAAPMLATASPSEQDDTAVSGTIVCGGNYFNRNSNSEAHRTTYVMRNLNTDLSIRIDRMTMYEANGSQLFSYDAATLPLSRNEIVGGGDNSLEPFQSAQYRISDLLRVVGVGPLSRTRRPVQLHVEWSADARALIPEFVGVRTGRAINANGSIGAERGRHLKECRSVSTEQGRKKGHDNDDS